MDHGSRELWIDPESQNGTRYAVGVGSGNDLPIELGFPGRKLIHRPEKHDPCWITE